MKNFLFNGLPVVEYDNKYYIYTYYNNKVIKVSKDKFNEKDTLNHLSKNNLLVKPRECPGDYSDCVELVISLTNACNLRCKYCFIGENNCGITNISHDNIDKSLMSVKKLAQYKGKKKVYIQFFGGEPTLCPDDIKYSIKKAQEIMPEFKLEYGITTNGVFNDEIINLLMENNFIITVSMDGLPAFQDDQRIKADGTGTSSDVEKTLKKFSSRDKDVIIRITVTSGMLGHFKEIVDYLGGLGIRFIHFEPVTKGGRANDKESNIIRPDPNAYADELIDTINYAKEKKINILTSTLMNAMSPSYCFCDAVGKNKMAITYEGLFTSCLGVQSQEHPLAKQFVMKNGDFDYWYNSRFNSYVDEKNRSEKCINCFAKYICAGGCPSRNFYENGSVEMIDDMQCIATKKMLYYYILTLAGKKPDKEEVI